MTFAVRFLVGIFLLVFIQQPTTAQGFATKPVSVERNEYDFDRYEGYSTWSAADRRILRDLADGELDQHSLFDAALLIAGHDEKKIAKFRHLLSQSIGRCRNKVKDTDSQQTRLRVIFEHLSGECLHGEYQAELFDVGKTLASGDFNCLTATVLFRAYCKAFGIEVIALWEPSHVQCFSPHTTKTGFIVETTASSAKNAVSQLSMTSKLQNRQLTPSELIAKVYYNRSVDALTNERFASALGTTWVCSVLDPKDTAAQSNLRACLNNWALSASHAGKRQLARKLLDEGMRLDSGYEPFTRNRAILSND